MSRLDSFIRRLEAQRDCLGLAARLIADVPGPVLELGLGNGRTYDHLRALMPEREIYVFDRQIAAHPECVPDARHMILGDIRETLPTAAARIGGRAALAHCDIGTGNETANAWIAAFVAEHLPRLMLPRGLVVSDQELVMLNSEAVPLPDSVRDARYFMRRL